MEKKKLNKPNILQKMEWGGIRQGSGAKPKNKVKRVTLSCRIDETTHATLEALMVHFKISKGEAVDYLANKTFNY